MKQLDLLAIRLKHDTLFILSIDKGEIAIEKGEVSPKFIADCKDVVRENKLQKGFVFLVRDAHGNTSIKTSKAIAAPIAQRFRNVWSFYS
jgi:hypothetical protein